MRHTPKSKTAQHTRKHFDWLNQVKADRALTASAFIVAFEIGQHFNRKRGGAVWPSYLTIANAVRLDEATVVRMVRRLHERGHIKIEPGKRGRGHPNRYFMVVQKGTAAHLSAGEKPAPAQVLRKKENLHLPPRKPAPTQENHLEPLKASPKGEAIKVEREREDAHALDVAGALKGAASSKEKKEDQARKETTDRRVVVLHTGGDHFAQVWAIWRRGYVQDDAPSNKAEAQRAFIKACNHPDPEVRTDPAEIVARARSWIERFPDEPRFLPKLIDWLEGRGWETEPPESRRRDNRYRRNGGKADLALLTLQHVGLAP